MPSSSPYATFRADAWMRESLIRPRKVLVDAAPSLSSRDGMGGSRRSPARSVVQGELFLFPVVVHS